MGILPVQEPEACTTFINEIGMLYTDFYHIIVHLTSLEKLAKFDNK